MEPWRPSNSDEGMWFESLMCERCENDRAYRHEDVTDMACDILTTACAGDQPAEWIKDEHGPRCTAFEPIETGPETGLARIRQVPGQLDIFTAEGHEA